MSDKVIPFDAAQRNVQETLQDAIHDSKGATAVLVFMWCEAPGEPSQFRSHFATSASHMAEAATRCTMIAAEMFRAEEEGHGPELRPPA